MAIVRWFQGLRRRWQVAIGLLVGLVLIGALTPSSPEPAETVSAPVGFTASPTATEAKSTRTPTPSPTPKSKALSETGVCVAAHEAAKTGLKAPSTAKFPDDFCKAITKSSELNESGQTVWTVTGPVDAQNSFGAMIRSTYTVQIIDLADGESGYRYKVISIEGQ